MKEYLKKLPPEIKEFISLAGKISKETRMPAYLVGGFVRDLLLGKKNFDLDIAVEGSGILFSEKLAKRLGSGIRIHERFGTATLILKGRLKVDIATARKERYPCCAALPVVSQGSLMEDLMRRDFTINAMAFGIGQGQEQKLIDPFGGRRDLAQGKIRILHDLSFKDDPTRILRAIRFQQRFGFRIEHKTLLLLKEAANSDLLHKVNVHRIRDELILMLKEDDPLKQIKALYSLAGLSFISPKLKPGKATYDLFKAIDKEIAWFTKKFPGRRHLDTWVIYLAALLEPLGLAEVKRICRSLALRNGEEKRIVSFRQSGPRVIVSLMKKGISPSRIYSLLEPLSYETIILLAAVSKNRYCREYIADFLEIYNGMRLYVSGHDLHGLGILPGPVYQKIFAKVLAAKLNAKVSTYEDELALIRRLIKCPGANVLKKQ
ncbi:MAG: CCA tRNA nucleotidyltransferase [Candidatus Omnitrophica bacterium]|nr:CCA tRNA nucleotidyltransferase [Candidatus Omnitrophota bacterium]